MALSFWTPDVYAAKMLQWTVLHNILSTYYEKNGIATQWKCSRILSQKISRYYTTAMAGILSRYYPTANIPIISGYYSEKYPDIIRLHLSWIYPTALIPILSEHSICYKTKHITYITSAYDASNKYLGTKIPWEKRERGAQYELYTWCLRLNHGTKIPRELGKQCTYWDISMCTVKFLAIICISGSITSDLAPRAGIHAIWHWRSSMTVEPGVGNNWLERCQSIILAPIN